MNEHLAPPRWKDGPPICTAENLPAFESKSAISAYHATNCPSVQITEQWQCKGCGLWHFDGTGPDPAGSTSGTTRSQRHTPRRRVKFWERKEGQPQYVPVDDKADRAEDKLIQKDMRKDAGVL